MIGDLCKPMNEGENNTVRLIMVVPEAERLLDELDRGRRRLPCDDPTHHDAYDQLRRILKAALEREARRQTSNLTSDPEVK